jgi:hypothetical protein
MSRPVAVDGPAPVASLTLGLAALCGLLLLVLSGCAVSSDAAAEVAGEPAETAAPRAVAESRTITDVLTVPATVVAGVEYTVTAPEVGSLRQAGEAFEFAPASGGAARRLDLPDTVTSTEPIVPLDVRVGSGTPVLLVNDTALTLQVATTPAQVLRLAERTPSRVRAQIEGSTGPFECGLNDPRPTVLSGEPILSCRIPVDVPAVAGATGVLALTLDEKENVVALPLEAVAGARERGLVYPADGGAAREVTLGVSDGAYIEIREGLAAGDAVLIPSPSILDG